MCVADGREAAGQRGALRRGRVRRVPAPLLPSAVTVAQPPAAAAAATAGRKRRRRGAHGRHDAARLHRARIPVPGHGGGRRAAASVEAGRDRSCGYSGGPRAYWSAGTGIATNRNRLCHSTLSARCGRRWAAQRAVVAPRSPAGRSRRPARALRHRQPPPLLCSASAGSWRRTDVCWRWYSERRVRCAPLPGGLSGAGAGLGARCGW